MNTTLLRRYTNYIVFITLLYYVLYLVCNMYFCYIIQNQSQKAQPKAKKDIVLQSSSSSQEKKSSISFLLPGLFIKLMQGYFLGEKYYYYIYCVLELHTLCVFYKIRLSASSDFCQTSAWCSHGEMGF